MKNKKKIALVTMAKDEDLYLQEWIDYHLKLGFDDIFIYQNNWRFNAQKPDDRVHFLEWDKPSPTIVAHLYKDGLMFLHPDEKQARSITVKEAALLQSFPNDFEFVGSQGVAFKMIGNAVPPELARNIGLGILKELNKIQ